MPRTQQQLDRAAAEARAWLDSLDPAIDKPEDISDLQAVAEAVDAIADAERRLGEAVAVARANGRSWGRISLALGVTKQAARQRFDVAALPVRGDIGHDPALR